MPFVMRAVMPRRSSAESAVSPTGQGAPPPEKGSMRTARGGGAGASAVAAPPALAGTADCPAQASKKTQGRAKRWGPETIGRQSVYHGAEKSRRSSARG